MYVGNKMLSLIEIELENAQCRYNTLKQQGRSDTTARVVLDRIQREIHTLQKKVTHEEEPRQEVITRADTSRFTRRISKIINRYWTKCNGDNHTIPSIPAIKTL
jgi:cob(I)alamin adenosyltransferase